MRGEVCFDQARHLSLHLARGVVGRVFCTDLPRFLGDLGNMLEIQVFSKSGVRRSAFSNMLKLQGKSNRKIEFAETWGVGGYGSAQTAPQASVPQAIPGAELETKT